MPIKKGKSCVGDVMGEFKRGQLHSGKKGPVVKDRKQAIAIALNVCDNAELKELLLEDGWSEAAIDSVLFEEKKKKTNPAYEKGLTDKEKAIAKREAKETMKKKGPAKKVYEDWESDKKYKKRKKKQGKKMPKSKATEAYERKYGKSDNTEHYSEMNFSEGLKKKAKESGIPLGILRQVYAKGMAAWKGGHRPGVAPQQWAMARVNSFITGSGKARQADASLWKKAKAAKARKGK